MLPALRNRRGRPTWLVRGLALLVALLLAGPLSLLVLRMLSALLPR